MLRKSKSPQTVSAVGWAWLMIGVLIALFLGGAYKTLLSDVQVSNWIKTQIKNLNPPFDVKFRNAKLILADGWYPKFGLRIEGLEVLPKDECRFRAKVLMSHLFVPIRIHADLNRPISLGDLKGDEISVEFLQVCQVSSTESSNDSNANQIAQGNDENNKISKNQISTQKTQHYFENRWDNDVAQTRLWLKGLDFRNLKIKGLNPPFDQLEIEQLEVEIANMEPLVSILARLKLNSVIRESQTDETFDIIARIEKDKIQIESRLPVHEGKITFAGRVDIPTNTAVANADLEFVPTFLIVDTIKNFSRISDPLDLRRSWLSGSAEIKFQEVFGKPDVEISVKEVSLKGDSGEIQSKDLKFIKANGDWTWQPFEVNFKQLSFKYLLEATGRKGYTGVITNFGSLDGQLRVDQNKELDFKGKWKDFDLAFSRRSQRVYQKISSISGHLEFKKDRMVGLVNEIELQNGRVDGFASFNLDRRALDGVFQIRIERLDFSPDVQKLMMGGQLGSIALFGQGRMQQGQVTSWSGEVGTQRLEGENWTVTGLKIKSEFANQMMSLGVKIKGAEFAADHWLSEKLRPALLSAKSTTPEAMSFQLITVKMDLEKDSGRWKNGLASLNQSGVIAATSGEWSGGELSGIISVDKKHSKMNKWTIKGPWNDFTIY